MLSVCSCASLLLFLQEEAKVEVVEPTVPDEPVLPFQQLYISCPDGLAVTFLLEAALGQ